MAGGRPSKYKPEFCEMLKEHMAQGYSFESFAAVVGVSSSTLYSWTTEAEEFCIPPFLEAKKQAFDLNRLFWEKQGIEGLHDETDYEDGKPVFKKSLNATVWIFNMKNRFGWKDKQEISGDPNAPLKAEIKHTVDLSGATADQLMDIIRGQGQAHE